MSRFALLRQFSNAEGIFNGFPLAVLSIMFFSLDLWSVWFSRCGRSVSLSGHPVQVGGKLKTENQAIDKIQIFYL